MKLGSIPSKWLNHFMKKMVIFLFLETIYIIKKDWVVGLKLKGKIIIKRNPFFTEERISRLESIGMVWNIKDDHWETMYRELEKYREIYGNIRVPQSYITDSGLLLGSWLNLQRQKYNRCNISSYRKNKLETLGMIWNPKKLVEDSWNIKFQLLKEYKEQYNKLPIVSYVTSDGIKLGAWLSVQRCRYNSDKLLLERKLKLEELGVFCDAYKDNWNRMYQQAKAFYRCKGSYDKKLSAWFSRQRRQYFNGKLSHIQIEKLESIGMVWSPSKYYWDKMYEQAKYFYITHGHLHISKNPNTSENYKLGVWIDDQRRMYRSDKGISKEHIEKLESIGMKWILYRSPQEIWTEWYLKAKEFYKKNKHLNPSKGKLNTWLRAQRAAKKGVRGKITIQQIELLNQIGMVWDIKEVNWNKMYECAKEYYQIHEMLNIPVNYITEDGYKLGVWISRQRKVYKDIINNNKNLSKIMQKRIRLLNQIDMIWDASKLTTKTSFQEKAIFYYLSKIYHNVQKISQWEFIGYELDIYIPSIKTAIEYDGIWHKNTLENDNKKNKACKDNGITLIRIRESGLPEVSDCSLIIEVERNDESFENAIKKLFSLLNVKYDYFDISKNRSKILQTYKDYTSHSWDYNYEKVYAYYKSNGYLFPITKDSKIDKHLRYWIHSQRDHYKNGLLIPFQVKKLQKIHFDFGPNESRWQKVYQLAIFYYNEHHNLKVPYDYIAAGGVRLGLWLYKQKRLYHNNKLDLNHIKLLEKLEIDWRFKEFYRGKSDITKNIYFRKLKEYYKQNGNIDITLNYISDSGLKLGEWLSRRRKDYKNKKLDRGTIVVLNGLKIKWDVMNDRWEDMFIIAKDYYFKYGNLFISANYVTEDGIHLGDWISRQRQKFNGSGNHKLLTKQQIKKLNSIEMVWDPYREKWLRNYEYAKKFYQENGHLNVSANYVTEDGVKLGMWIHSQRQANRGNPNYLMTVERKRLLDDIHMNWNLKNPNPNARKRK